LCHPEKQDPGRVGSVYLKEMKGAAIVSAHPEMANFPDTGVALKILSSEYQPYACGKIFQAP
jgi:hypothetical protein